jgi:exosortase family protein XrtF
MYKSYLNTFDSKQNQVDGITKFVAHQTEICLNFFGEKSRVMQHEKEASYKIVYHNSYLARIVEGCNAISVIICICVFCSF